MYKCNTTINILRSCYYSIQTLLLIGMENPVLEILKFFICYSLLLSFVTVTKLCCVNSEPSAVFIGVVSSLKAF